MQEDNGRPSPSCQSSAAAGYEGGPRPTNTAPQPQATAASGHRSRRPPQLPRVDLEATIDLSSDTSVDDQVLQDPDPQPPVVNLDSSLESLPDIDPRPQHQLPVPSLPGDLLPPLQHRVLREACVLLERISCRLFSHSRHHRSCNHVLCHPCPCST